MTSVDEKKCKCSNCKCGEKPNTGYQPERKEDECQCASKAPLVKPGIKI